MKVAAQMRVPFNCPSVSERALAYIGEVLRFGHLAGDGPFSKKCERWLERQIGGSVRLTHSCTAALEMAAILTRVGPSDEVVMPSFTFASTANAFVLRGATPVFVDITPDTLNINPERIETAITDRTKVIVAVHYAGVCAEMQSIHEIAERYSIIVVEDAAQALLSTYRGKPAGSFGSYGCFSFHETKNIVSGEGGAIAINNSEVERADIIREKGTNRVAFRNRIVDRYTWIDIGSSYLPGELIAACLFAELERAREITDVRRRLWGHYHEAFAPLEARELVRRPIVPAHCGHNGHLYYLLMKTKIERDRLISDLSDDGILAPFHYVPLHSSPAGRKYGIACGPLNETDSASDRLVRMPLFLTIAEQEYVIERVDYHVRKMQ